MDDRITSPTLTYAYALIILRWHQEYGVDRAWKDKQEWMTRYLDVVADFTKSDLHNLNSQRELARVQISGELERFYGASVPSDLWDRIMGKLDLSEECPARLGDIARLIEKYQSVEGESSSEGKRFVLSAQSREQILSSSREFYADLIKEEDKGIGGLNILLSTSLERTRIASGKNIVLLSPEILGLRYVNKGERPDDILDKVRQGELVIRSAIGEPKGRQ
jgi:hypothetical protein